MRKIVLAFGIMAGMLVSCSGSKQNDNATEQQQVEIITPDYNDLIIGTIVNDKGEKLEYTFNSADNTAVFVLNGEAIKMDLDTTKASGSNYKNDHYTYTEWQGIIELKKDGETLFHHKDDIVKNVVKDKDGKELTMTFNNTRGIATFVLNGEVIDLKQDTVASGIKYSNKNYEYTEHQGKIELRKGGAVVFSVRKK